MALDYSLLKSNNIKRYGTDIGRIGPMLLANRYDDRTHFIYELLQNAEDALKKRVNSNGPRNVQFYLSKDGLKVSHYGKLFDEEDVHGICGIGESTKPDELTAIGKFGIGFKAVYAFTEQPEVHSGDEHFAIDSFVWPREVKSITSDSKETVFWFPFRPDDVSAYSDILTGLKKLGARTLLFLREIEVISWSTDDGQSGYYLRDKPKILEQNIRKVALIGQEKNLETIDEEWLIFSKEVETNDKVKAGFVEIAYALEKDKSNKNESIIPIKGSTLTVYFPTIVPTHLGFLVQGPYRTTPSRDNVPRKDSWNIHLVNQTANLLIETLQYLRDKKLLSTKTLQALPIDQTKFPVDSMFAKLYEIVKDALQKELLLPAYRNGYISGIQAKLGRTKEIRELLNPAQLSSLFGSSDVIDWLSGDITINQTPELRQYLMWEIDVQEVDADTIIMKLTKEFLEKQSDEWISLFYSFLSLQPSLARLYNHTPLIRLEDGSHCIPSDNNGVRRVFLPSSHQSGFPTVKRSVCNDPQALKFLKSLDLKEPDPVDDVIQNILSKFVNSISIEFYNEALTKVISAYQTDSASQKNKLVEFLKKTPFVMCRNAKSSEIQCKLPSDLYFSTDKLTALFFEIEEIWFVDPDCEILKGELQRRLLEECGVRDYLRRIEWNSDLDWRQREELRRQKGAISSSREDLKDYDVIGLKKVALKITYLPPETIKSAALSLWNVLLDALREARENYFKGSYQWEYFRNSWETNFPAKFVRDLKSIAWLPGKDDKLYSPGDICFSEVCQEINNSPNPILQELLGFKPEAIKQLAAESGIDVTTLELLRKHNLGSDGLFELLKKVGLEKSDSNVNDALNSILGKDREEPTKGIDTTEVLGGQGSSFATPGKGNVFENPPGNTGTQQQRFATYVYVSNSGSNDDEKNRDEYFRKEKIGRAGVDYAIEQDHNLGFEVKEMPHTNEGYDLEVKDNTGMIQRYVEVKSTRHKWGERGVALSYPQFQAAQIYKDKFWIYVVENVESEDRQLFRIQNPAINSQYFVFDDGWKNLASK